MSLSTLTVASVQSPSSFPASLESVEGAASNFPLTPNAFVCCGAFTEPWLSGSSDVAAGPPSLCNVEYKSRLESESIWGVLDMSNDEEFANESDGLIWDDPDYVDACEYAQELEDDPPPSDEDDDWLDSPA